VNSFPELQNIKESEAIASESKSLFSCAEVAEQTFEKLHKIGRKVTVGHFSDLALNN
jgi:hypothetical protein